MPKAKNLPGTAVLKMNPIKILYIARGGGISGSQRQLLNLLHRLDKTAYEPLVVCSEGGDLATKLSEMHVIDGHNAIRLDSRYPDALASAMEKLLSDPTHHRHLAANTRPHIRQHLDVRLTVEQTQLLYNRLLGRKLLGLQEGQV